MKNKLINGLAITVITLSANAASYIINNGSGATASGIVDSEGRAFRSSTTVDQAFTGASGGTSAGPGIVSVGIFSESVNFSTFTTASDFVNAFTNFGNITNTFAAAGATGNRGVYSVALNNITVASTSFAGKNMYLFAGNGTTLANSTEFLVFRSNNTFNAADDSVPTATTYTFRPSLGTTLWGSELPDVKTASTDASTTAGWQMAAPVPETSTSLLGALGALALLRRRRN
jgi:hypothetical protein